MLKTYFPSIRQNVDKGHNRITMPETQKFINTTWKLELELALFALSL